MARVLLNHYWSGHGMPGDVVQCDDAMAVRLCADRGGTRVDDKQNRDSGKSGNAVGKTSATAGGPGGNSGSDGKKAAKRPQKKTAATDKK